MNPLRPAAPIAPDALLPGDPARALFLAQELMVKPKMSNHSHGLWGYWGQTEDGRELTIQSLGIGGPSAAMVLSQLAELGVKRVVGVGTCRAIDPGLALGDVLLVAEAIGDDGVSRALSGEDAMAGAAGVRALEPDPALRGALGDAVATDGVPVATVASTDLLGDLDGRPAEWEQRGAVAVEMTTAALFATASRRGIAAASMLVVSDAGEQAIAEEQLQESSLRIARAALAAFSSSG
jgi:uridine phosphorylase